MKQPRFREIGNRTLVPRSNYIKKFSPDFYMGMHNHGYFEIMYAQKGSFDIEFSSDPSNAETTFSVTVDQGSFIFIDAYVYHRLCVQEEGVEICNIEFESKPSEEAPFGIRDILPVNYRALIRNTSLSLLADAPNGFLIAPDLSGVESAMHAYILLLARPAKTTEDACFVQLDLLSVLMHISKSIALFKENEVYFTKKVYIYIKSRLHRKLTLEEIANAMGYNKSYLTSQFKKQTGKTIMQTIAAMRISKSLRLLQNSNLSVTEIAAQVGFSSYTKMAYTFQKVLGLSPSACRKHFINDEIAHPSQSDQSSSVRVATEDYLLDDELFYASYYKKEISSKAEEILKQY